MTTPIEFPKGTFKCSMGTLEYEMGNADTVAIRTLGYYDSDKNKATFVSVSRVELQFCCHLKLLNVKWSAADTTLLVHPKEWKKEVSLAAKAKIKESVSQFWMHLVEMRPYLLDKAKKAQKAREIQSKRDTIQQNINQIALLQKQNAELGQQVATMKNTQ